MSFVRAPFPIWQFIDPITGLPLNDQYWVSFLTNDLPYIPQLVYQDNQGITPWSDPIELSSAGQLPDNLYFDPDLVYRIEVRQGPLSSDPLIDLIEDYVPTGANSINPNVTGTLDNQISNPQFAFLSFTSPLTISTAGTYEVAPGWTITLVGTGTATITQKVYSASQNLPDHPVPPFALEIDTEGSWSSVYLQQQFNPGGLWANEFVSMSVLARSANGIANNISLVYKDSVSLAVPIIVAQEALTTGSSYQLVQGLHAVPASTNTTPSSSAYVDIQIILPPVGITDISNVQVMGQQSDLGNSFAVTPDETLQRQTDHLFHYYKPQLFFKQIPSYLVGWDFALNPAQFYGNNGAVPVQAVGANKSYYAWDQTILFQSADSAITVSRDTIGSIILTAAVATQMAVIQYLPQIKARELMYGDISVNLRALATNALGTPITVSLWSTTGSLPSTVASHDSLVTGLNAAGKPTVVGGWTEIKTYNLQDQTVTVQPTSFNDYSFDVWNAIVSAPTTVTYFAIVIGTGPMAIADEVIINSVGLCSGQIATRPATQTPDEVLRECEYYYEKSYDTNVKPGTTSSFNLIQVPQLGINVGGTSIALIARSINIDYKTVKNSTPSAITIYTPAGVVNNVEGYLLNGAVQQVTTPPGDISTSNWILKANGIKSALLWPVNVSSLLTAAVASNQQEAFINYQFTADSRLGY